MVHTSHQEFNRRLRVVFERLNLKKHLVGNKYIQACGDIEGHWGKDGELYLLDFARVFPPGI